MNVHEAWNAVMTDLQGLAKGERNTQGRGYNFRGIDAVMNAAGPVFREHGVHVVPEELTQFTYAEVLSGTNRTPMGQSRVLVRYRVYGPEGDSFPMMAPGEAFDSGDKATPKAMSVAYRTVLLQALTLPTDEPDPDSHTYERPERQQEPQVPPLRRAQARAWDAAVRAYPNATDDQRRAEAAALMREMGTDPTRATTEQWEQTAIILEGTPTNA